MSWFLIGPLETKKSIHLMIPFVERISDNLPVTKNL